MQRLANRLGRNNVRQDDDNAVPAQDAQPGPSGRAAGSSRARVAGLPARVRNGGGSALRRERAAPTLGALPLSYDAQLAQWESAAPAGEEAARRAAVERIQHLVEKWLASKLNLNNLGLTSLPPLPDKLKHLHANGNRLATLPELPSGLTKLDASHNQLTALPALPSKLEKLFVVANYLTTLSALPQSLQTIEADYNLLQTLPTYPKKLRYVAINENPFDPAFCPPREPFHNSSYDNLTKRIRKWQSEHPQFADQTMDQSIQAYLDRVINWSRAHSNGQYAAVVRVLKEIRKTPPDPQLALDFDGLMLPSLPELPAGLKQLNCARNQLTTLPALPAGLQVLHCDSNQLTTLPELPVGLNDLSCSNNQLTTLPRLPDGLQTVQVSGNPNLEVPPQSDFWYGADYARQLRHWQRGNLQGRVVENARWMVEAFVGYLSWGIDYAARVAPEYGAAAPAQPFNPALGPHHWHFAETENNAESFNQFSQRLSQIAEYTNAASRSGLTTRVDALVADMRTSPALREICFSIAADATQSCGDRIALGLNDMQLARIDYKASAGHYSMRQLFSMGEQFFKMAALDRIVVEKIGQLRNAGLTIYPIEIRLAYQTELSSRLGLPGVVRSMLYRHHAHVSAGDISGAERQIRQMMERGEAVDFLVQWRPWRQQLERQFPEEYERVRVFNQPAREAIACQPRGMTEQRWREAFDRQAANEAAQFTDTTDRLTRAFMEEHDIG